MGAHLVQSLRLSVIDLFSIEVTQRRCYNSQASLAVMSTLIIA